MLGGFAGSRRLTKVGAARSPGLPPRLDGVFAYRVNRPGGVEGRMGVWGIDGLIGGIGLWGISGTIGRWGT